MTIGKFFRIFFIQLLVLLVLKYLFFTLFDYGNPYVRMVYWAVTVVIVTALARRLGILNFLEAIFTAGFWFVFGLFFDFFIIQPVTGITIFSTWALWGGYIALVLSVFFFHKKRHIHIRKEQAAHHH